MSSVPALSRASILRIVIDLLAEELAASRGREKAAWDEATRLDDEGLDLDSLERLSVSAALNEFFHLHEYGAEDYLLSLRSVGEYCDLIEQSLAATGTFLTFRTSGSTGKPKRCTHRVADLMVEVNGWAKILGPVAQVVGMVPAHHIYGTIFAALLPDRLGVPFVHARSAGAVGQAEPGSLMVATPTHWAYLSRSLVAFPPELTGVSSTAAMSEQLAHTLCAQGLERLIEVYGSSETGGIACRKDPIAPFELLEHWTHAGAGRLKRNDGNHDLADRDMPDAANWVDDRHFTLNGRRDGAVQVGGYNVFPEHVRAILLTHPGVEAAAVRYDAESGRLKAFVVPVDLAEDERIDELIDELDVWCGARMRAHERPRRIAVGAALPGNAIGKLADW